MPKVSIILTSYNKPLYVGEAIESVINQTEKDWELFIMDDNSNEETIKVIRSYLQDPRITYINSQIKDENRYKTTRYAVLINEAIPITTGNYLCYLTDDTIYLPNRLEVMINFFSHNPGAEVIYSSQKIHYVNHQKKIQYVIELNAEEILTKAANKVDHCSVMHTKNIAEKVYMKYGSYWNEDPEYWFNADAVFWSRLNSFTVFYPISEILDISRKTPHSFQNLSSLLPKTIPDGTVVKGLINQLYVIDLQKRRALAHEMFKRLKFKNVVEIPDPVLFMYLEGCAVSEKVLPNQILVKTKDSSSIYYIQKGKKRLIKNSQTLFKYKFNVEEIVELDSDILQSLSNGPNITESISKGTLLPDGVIFFYEGCFYISYNNFLCFIQTDVAAFKLKLSLDRAVHLDKNEFSIFQQGLSYTWKLSFQ
ncbi:glycosyltransferase family 2 protein [Priestia sp. TRN 1309]|uniref:glycosyltransferase family 2 protein n=1 Tax=Priestia sp. TRN 1309 TaxID=3420729 RepID=UPI003D770FB4